jgi:hypothetical protein
VDHAVLVSSSLLLLCSGWNAMFLWIGTDFMP